ncbi:MAG: SLC13 family permease, partial [Bdellovibrionales bacterium]|nr:SLC13 family permease [Bdellovibrionales bacterium]
MSISGLQLIAFVVDSRELKAGFRGPKPFMSIDIVLFLVILFGGFALLATEFMALEMVAFCVLLALVFTGLLPASDAFDSFGNQSIFLIGSLFVLIAGLRKTGIVSRLEDIITIVSDRPRWITFGVVLFVVAFISAFVSNAATLAVCIPLVVRLAKRYGESARSWLMPVAFASVLGGMNSLIGTSTNIIISSLLPAYGIPEFRLFTTAYVGFPILLVGLLYLLIFAKVILRRDDSRDQDDVEVKYDLRAYTAEILVQGKSPLANKTLSSTALFKEADVTVLNIIREGMAPLFPHAGFLIRSDDRLLVEGNIAKLTEITDKYGLQFREEAKAIELQEGKKKNDISIEFHEVLIASDSLLVNRKPSGVSLRNRFGISLIAINRKGETLRSKLSDLKMESGDILVVQFLSQVDNDLLDYLGLVPLQKINQERLLSNRAWLAAGIFVAALLFGSITSFPLSITCLAGAVSLPILKILKMNEFYTALEWRILLFIGAILSL